MLQPNDTLESTRACSRCGEVQPIENFSLYGYQPGRRRQCRTCRSEWRRSWYRRRKGTEANDRAKQAANATNRRLRLQVIAAYGGACECCGETETLLLNVDHIHNDGAVDRIDRSLVGAKFNYFLRRNGYPKDRYQLLCYSCNMGKARQGECPHRQNTPSIVEMALKL